MDHYKSESSLGERDYSKGQRAAEVAIHVRNRPATWHSGHSGTVVRATAVGPVWLVKAN